MEKALAAPGNLTKLMVHSPDNDPPFYNETYFRHMLRVERMRTERSKKPFLPLLVDISEVMVKYHQEETLANIKTALLPSLREVDVRGWYHNNHTIGIIFTEIREVPDNFTEIIIQKIYNRLRRQLDPDLIKNISISFHLFPEPVFFKQERIAYRNDIEDG
jgi:hypothetical protein